MEFKLQLEEAQELLKRQVTKITETEQIPLMEASGRVLAEDIAAVRDQPPFPRSPLDGYALRAEDAAQATREHPVRLRVIGKIFAGDVFDGTIGRGEAVRLMTGAPIPEGADTVIRQEDTRKVAADNSASESGSRVRDNRLEAEGNHVDIFVTSEPYKNYCFQGEDYEAGTLLLKKDAVLDAGKICVLASLGYTEVTVYRRPRVAVISTGDEVLSPGTPWQPGKIYDSNRAYLCARLCEAGNPAVFSKHISDDAQAAANVIQSAAEACDLVITTGGVSVGEKDILHDVVDLLNVKKLFWKVCVKPGSPTLAFVCNGTPVLCLSGNPFGAIANFELLARPVLAKLSGNEGWILRSEMAILQNDYKKPAGTRRFLRGWLEDGKVTVNGRNQSSGAIASMADCNCMIEIAPDMAGACAGESVRVYQL